VASYKAVLKHSGFLNERPPYAFERRVFSPARRIDSFRVALFWLGGPVLVQLLLSG